MSEPAHDARIAHVLFLDLVGFSQRSTTSQGRILDRLNARSPLPIL
jgi:hypothetical protein